MTNGRRIALGSTNDVKYRATVAAVDPFSIEFIERVDVDSGVPDQPIGHAETRQGARTRATRALGATDAGLGIGIEGGIGTFPGTADPFVIMWAAVESESRTIEASGPSIPIPEDVADRARAGTSLGSILATDHGPAAAQDGAAGIYTDGRLDREAALQTAVAVAIGRYELQERSGA